jgi:hypothetical protein
MRAQFLIRLSLLSLIAITASGAAFSFPPHNENKDERMLSLKSVLRRKNDVFVSNDAGIFRASLSEKRWERVTLPEMMPRGGSFADEPEDAKVIFYYAYKYPSATRGESGDPGVYGLYLSEDDGRSWRLVSAKSDYGPVFLHPNGTLYAVTNALTFMDRAHVWMSKDAGVSWREITGKSFGMILRIFADPAHPDLVCLAANSIRNYIFQATDENYDWRVTRELARDETPGAKSTLPASHYSTRTVLYMLGATLNNYFEFDFGELTSIPAFDLVPAEARFTFGLDQRKVVSFSLRFLPEDSVISEVGRSQQPPPTTIKIPDQKEGTDLWGINILKPDGNLVSVQPYVTKRIYEARERAEALSRIKAEGNFLTYDFSRKRPLTRSIDLGRLYDFPVTGTYRVQLVYDNSWLNDFSDEKWVGTFGSRVFEVTIK